MGIFDNVQSNSSNKNEWSINENEAITCLSYLLYGEDGFKDNEDKVFVNTLFDFLPAFNGDFRDFLDPYHELRNSFKTYELIPFLIENIEKGKHKRLFVYLVDGVMSDGKIDAEERNKIELVMSSMGIDEEFAQKVVEVMKAKYEY